MKFFDESVAPAERTEDRLGSKETVRSRRRKKRHTYRHYLRKHSHRIVFIVAQAILVTIAIYLWYLWTQAAD